MSQTEKNTWMSVIMAFIKEGNWSQVIQSVCWHSDMSYSEVPGSEIHVWLRDRLALQSKGAGRWNKPLSKDLRGSGRQMVKITAIYSISERHSEKMINISQSQMYCPIRIKSWRWRSFHRPRTTLKHLMQNLRQLSLGCFLEINGAPSLSFCLKRGTKSLLATLPCCGRSA